MVDLILTPDEVGRAWQAFSGAPIQAVLSAWLSQRIEESRTALETCVAADMPEHQAAVRALRSLKNEIHSKDGPNLKKSYERRS